MRGRKVYGGAPGFREKAGGGKREQSAGKEERRGWEEGNDRFRGFGDSGRGGPNKSFEKKKRMLGEPYRRVKGGRSTGCF